MILLIVFFSRIGGFSVKQERFVFRSRLVVLSQRASFVWFLFGVIVSEGFQQFYVFCRDLRGRQFFDVRGFAVFLRGFCRQFGFRFVLGIWQDGRFSVFSVGFRQVVCTFVFRRRFQTDCWGLGFGFGVGGLEVGVQVQFCFYGKGVYLLQLSF